MEIKQGGRLGLHWHKETENYFIYEGRAIFTIGDKEFDVDGDKDPTHLTIPGNVPHEIYNPYPKTMKLFYYFPGGATFKDDITYYFPDGSKRGPGSEWL